MTTKPLNTKQTWKMSFPLKSFFTATLCVGAFYGGAASAHDSDHANAPEIRDYINSHCAISLGWSDDCNDCTRLPSRTIALTPDGQYCAAEGDFNEGRCLAAGETHWGSLGVSGDVDSNDTFYVSFKCY